MTSCKTCLPLFSRCEYFGSRIWWMTWFVWSDFEALPGGRPDSHTRLTRVKSRGKFLAFMTPRRYNSPKKVSSSASAISHVDSFVWAYSTVHRLIHGAAFLHQSAVWTHPLEKWQCEHMLLVLVSRWKHSETESNQWMLSVSQSSTFFRLWRLFVHQQLWLLEFAVHCWWCLLHQTVWQHRRYRRLS